MPLPISVIILAVLASAGGALFGSIRISQRRLTSDELLLLERLRRTSSIGMDSNALTSVLLCLLICAPMATLPFLYGVSISCAIAFGLLAWRVNEDFASGHNSDESQNLVAHVALTKRNLTFMLVVIWLFLVTVLFMLNA